ncbi:hypothetical protein E1B28_000597 [Marasmius oreades]|uniref:SEC7 domain-containing protein n=1 Tax=Marasmius oreades TaxID=181124 RepID=A0A9P8AEN0_9AGAR|nr:uncharacterized protein E1B28_000597 [Marasmius oreades]KAG7098683.1 hypothetical protein E1B28_000597 [Marasmius oreades]
MDIEQSAATEREQRMLAVAKLKRAASLPRLKDGRRPPMHTEAVSEGEKGNPEEELKPDIDTPPPEAVEEPVENEQVGGGPSAAEVEAEDLTVSSPPTRSKRRSRSRSRSRGSRDFKGKARAQQSPTPTLIQGDSSQDEALIPSQITLPVIPHLISPVPSQLQRSMLLSRTPTPTSQEHTLFQYPGTSPPTPLPTLEALQKGLFRSNSAGRMMAMHKLTGGTEIYEPSPSPTPPISAKFRRNNTVSGGERSAARKKLIDTLGSRSKATAPSNADLDQGSGTEELHTPQAPSPLPTHKRRRRRSRRGSSAGGAGSAATPEPDLPPTTSNTPQVPPTALPPSSLDNYSDIRALTATPNQTSSSGAHSPRNPSPLGQTDESHLSPSSVNVINPTDRDRPERTRRRSVVVEEEEEDQSPVPFNPPPLPSTPPNLFVTNGFISRLPHSSDPSSDMSGEYTRTSGINIPVYISHRAPSREDGFPSSPFGTPLKEKPSRDEEEEERVLYPADTYRDRSMYGNDNEFEREISWVASPVPEIRMPIHDDDDDGVEEEYEEEQIFEDRPSSPQSSGGEGYEDTSPRVSSGSQNVGGESETSPDTTPSYAPPSPSSVAPLSVTASVPRESDGSVSPTSYPTRLSVVSRIQGERSPMSPDFGDFDPSNANDVSSKRSGDSTSTSAWEKVKNTFRSNSSLGRRSRSNSIVTPSRREQTESSASRESGASLTSPKLERSESTSTFAAQQGQPPMMSPSASNSILSLSPTPGSRSGTSPVPPPNSADLSKYQNAKLFPFPGMKKLEEERNRAKGLHIVASASTPDVSAIFSSSEDGIPFTQLSNPAYTSARLPLVQKVSDTNLVGKYMAPPLSSSQSSQPDYFNITPSPSSPNTNSIKLPMTLPGVKQWLSKNLKHKVSSQDSSPASLAISPPPIGNGSSFKKPSLSDLLRIRKDSELGTEWEELGNTSTDTSGNTLTAVKSQPHSPLLEEKEHVVTPMTPPATSPTPLGELSEVEKTPKAQRNMTSPMSDDDNSRLPILDQSTALPSPPDALSTTPDPSSSLSDYPLPSTSDCSSTSSRYSVGGFPGPQGAIVLQQLEEQLSRSSRSPMWAAAIDDPPRKLILSSPVLQVVNSNTVKDRFLFLFNDLFVIAKPVLQEDDVVTDRPVPFPERRFIVKSVVQLQHVRVPSDRSEPSNKASGVRVPPRNPIIRTFVLNFSKDPDYAISALFSKSGISDDPILLGQLLFRTTEIDRVQLGSYLSQRTSKLVLKSYLDSFGFVHLRVDRALRVFLLSLHVPSRSVSNHSALEYLLDAFASRWYEANARFIAYDKDLAIRLVRGLNQLNDLLHGGLASEPGLSGTPRRNITSRDFIDAFRRCDGKCLVPDELLEDIYRSIRVERLCHARNTQATGKADIIISNKRPLPPRLTYKVTSEPVSFRIPQPDPHFCIHLYGQDLIIDPPVLTFEKSSEARFRVTGNSLGPKTIIMRRSGSNALKYAGLPLALRITIERAFMRHTFQVAFINHCGNKRRYMFSVDDALIRHQWTVSLRQHVDNSISAAATSSASPGPSKFYRAAENVAFRVLQEILIGPAACSGPAGVMEAAIRRLNDSRVNGYALSGPEYSLSSPVQRNVRIPPLHVRSKSRSKVYHRTRAGKNESDLVMNGRLQDQDSFDNGTKASSPGSSDQQAFSDQSDSPTWSGRDLEMQCLQNSSIALVLSYLQVGSPEHVLRSS